ncbi:PadR family transcriptional regulator [Desulfitobacterium sp.]|uniref:PadR family transcriptional regulator n=1 Tax=Desulfitobacterium sp. TaxID=49981 RepID=UPI002C74A0A6|nr:PadR family transcriptional regulator [Desulfitobacterium sp.]HVJ50579.1 PadR family transcriptional regulator [Desulfitobacterium sp.]
MVKKHGRHTSAFLLLLLSDTPSYGALLLTRLQTELPHCFSDSADVYRCLQEMDKDGLVETNWETRETGQPRKWYSITPKGMRTLQEQAKDIRLRYANFEFFLTHYKATSQDNPQ